MEGEENQKSVIHIYNCEYQLTERTTLYAYRTKLLPNSEFGTSWKLELRICPPKCLRMILESLCGSVYGVGVYLSIDVVFPFVPLCQIKSWEPRSRLAFTLQWRERKAATLTFRTLYVFDSSRSTKQSILVRTIWEESWHRIMEESRVCSATQCQIWIWHSMGTSWLKRNLTQWRSALRTRRAKPKSPRECPSRTYQHTISSSRSSEHSLSRNEPSPWVSSLLGAVESRQKSRLKNLLGSLGLAGKGSIPENWSGTKDLPTKTRFGLSERWKCIWTQPRDFLKQRTESALPLLLRLVHHPRATDRKWKHPLFAAATHFPFRMSRPLSVQTICLGHQTFHQTIPLLMWRKAIALRMVQALQL